MMPKQDCPVCGNRPTVFYENELEVALERASKKFKAIREHVRSLGWPPGPSRMEEWEKWFDQLQHLLGPTE